MTGLYFKESVQNGRDALDELFQTAGNNTVKYTSSAIALLLILLGLAGNSIILVGGVWYKAFRVDKVTRTLILHLAASDVICTLVFMVPGTITTMADTYPFGYTFCKVHFYMILTFGHSTVGHICVLTTSKLVSLHQPFRAQIWEKKNGHLFGAAIWALSTVPAIVLLSVNPDSLYYDEIRVSCMYDFSEPIWTYLLPTLSFFLALVPNIIVVTSTIGLIISSCRVAARGRESLKWQGVVAIILVALVYCISFSPHIGMNFMGNKFLHPSQTDRFMKIGIFVSTRLTLLNYVSNIFVYAASMRSFRRFLREKLLHCTGAGFPRRLMETSV